MTSASIAVSSPPPAEMVRDTWYHGADVAALFEDLVDQEWLARKAKLHKHKIVDALLLLAIDHADQLPTYLEKLAERRSAGEGTS